MESPLPKCSVPEYARYEACYFWSCPGNIPLSEEDAAHLAHVIREGADLSLRLNKVESGIGEMAVLCLAEYLANGTRHERGFRSVRIDLIRALTDGEPQEVTAVVGVVEDSEPGWSQEIERTRTDIEALQEPAATADLDDLEDGSGLGLGLVRAVAAQCGYYLLKDGKVVWFQVGTAPAHMAA
jgi:hypothetical protein